MKLVTTIGQVLKNISDLYAELEQSPDLADRLGLVHAWYVDTRNPRKPKFGFSKFIGYQDLDAETYLENYRNLNGRNTEWALKGFCEELRPTSPQYEEFHERLTEWLAEFGKTPRNPIRILVLNSERKEDAGPQDRRLLELLTAVADLLPLDQRHELRSRL